MGKLLAAVLAENLAGLHGDFLQRLQTVRHKGRVDDGKPFHAVFGQLRHRLVGVGLEPFLRPETRLEGRHQPLLRPAEPLHQQSRGLLALAMIGVALVEIGLRNAVIGGKHDLRLKIEALQMRFDRFRQRVDIDRLVVIGRHGAHRRLPAHGLECVEGFVVDARRRRGGILRIEREDQDALAALYAQPVEPFGDRWLAVAHRPVDDDIVVPRQFGRQLVGLAAGKGSERRFVSLRVPDRGIGGAASFRPGVEHDAVKDRVPGNPRPFNHPPVGQEFAQITPHRPVARAVRRAEVN